MKNVNQHIDTECCQWQLTAGNVYGLDQRCWHEYKDVDVKVESICLENCEMGTACLIGGAGWLQVHLDTPKNDL